MFKLRSKLHMLHHNPMASWNFVLLFSAPFAEGLMVWCTVFCVPRFTSFWFFESDWFSANLSCGWQVYVFFPMFFHVFFDQLPLSFDVLVPFLQRYPCDASDISWSHSRGSPRRVTAIERLKFFFVLLRSAGRFRHFFLETRVNASKQAKQT